MARNNAQAEMVGTATVSPAQAVLLIKGQIDRGRDLLAARPLSADAYSAWKLTTRNYLEKSFGMDSPNIPSVIEVGLYGSFPLNADPVWWESHHFKSLQTQIAKLGGLVEVLESEQSLQTTASLQAPPVSGGHNIFLVHGHDEAALHEVARFLEKLRQNVIILREQPNHGMTIIEKFEDYADVGFAVVLLTSDDRGGGVALPFEQLSFRARQNVIFELGYFIGRLGRNRVCALYRPAVEIPSDYSGVLYYKLDSNGGWQLQLSKELKAAGFDVDLNDAV